MNRGRFLALAGAALVPRGVPVLMYHAVNDTNPHHVISRSLTLPTARFEAQLHYLARHRIPTLTAGELVSALERGEHPAGVVLTFDDGYADAATVVLPLLQRYRARATFFINSSSVGRPNHVTWEQLRALRVAGMELGAHGARHLDLTTLDRAGQLYEAGHCLERLAHYAGVRPESYAYASGAYNRTTLDVMRTLGVRSAWTERYGTVHDARDPYEMPRLRVSRDTELGGFAALVA